MITAQCSCGFTPHYRNLMVGLRTMLLKETTLADYARQNRSNLESFWNGMVGGAMGRHLSENPTHSFAVKDAGIIQESGV